MFYHQYLCILHQWLSICQLITYPLLRRRNITPSLLLFWKAFSYYQVTNLKVWIRSNWKTQFLHLSSQYCLPQNCDTFFKITRLELSSILNYPYFLLWSFTENHKCFSNKTSILGVGNSEAISKLLHATSVACTV